MLIKRSGPLVYPWAASPPFTFSIKASAILLLCNKQHSQSNPRRRVHREQIRGASGTRLRAEQLWKPARTLRNLKLITIYDMVYTTQHYLRSSLWLCRNTRSTDHWWRREGWARSQKHRWERWRGCALCVSARLENCSNASACRSGKKKGGGGLERVQ